MMRGVGAAVAVDDVVAGAAEEQLVPAAAEHRVVAASPLIVVISVSVKVPLASSIRTVSSPRPARTAIRSNVGPVEGGVGRAVVAEVHLDAGRHAGLESQRDAVGAAVAGDDQRAAGDLGGAGGRGAGGADPGAGEHGAGGEQAGEGPAADERTDGVGDHGRLLSVLDLPLMTPPGARLFPVV